MIFLLDLILLVNLFVAFKYFKNVVSPPILMGAGMLAASLIATSYYNEWNLNTMLPKTVFILGGSTCFFTLYCIIYECFCRSKKTTKQFVEITEFQVNRVRMFLIFSVIIGGLGCLFKLYYFRAAFGSLDFAELIMARRLDEWTGTNDLYMPSYVRQFGSFTIVVSNFTLWLLAIMVCYNDNRVKKNKKLLFIHIGVIIFDGLLNGAKGYLYTTIMQFMVLYMFIYYAKKKNFSISRKTYKRFFIMAILLILSFRGINLVLGRTVEERTNSDLLAEYCGAEIKNFDILVHKTDGGNTKRWGENTFSGSYKDFNPNYLRLPGEFQYVGNYSLGNVYTQYGEFYKDWGIYSGFFINALIAIISMFFYKKSQSVLNAPMALNVYLFVYAVMAITIFMAFFSNRFIDSVIRVGWLRSIIYVIIMVWFLKKYVLCYKIQKINK